MSKKIANSDFSEEGINKEMSNIPLPITGKMESAIAAGIGAKALLKHLKLKGSK